MALFENYEGRMPQLQPVLEKYGFKDFDELKAYNNSKGVDAYKIVEGIQPICFENAKWAYELGAAIAMKEGVKTAAEAAKRGKRTVLNPAPGAALSPQLLKSLYLITPNETEAEIITGIRIHNAETEAEAARSIRAMGVQNVIITLGSRGAYICNDRFDEAVPAQKVRAVDTTAAGDVFNGALVVALSEGKSLEEAVRFASRASAISVTRMGAQSSIPYRSEVDRFVP